MDSTPNAIIEFAAKRVQEHWDAHQQPYLLSLLGPELLKEGVDYKAILGQQKLGDFIRGTPHRIRVVTHPTQRAKIGLIPTNQAFEYAAVVQHTAPEAPAAPTSSHSGKRSRRWYIVSNFLQLVSELDDEDRVKVDIPTPILTKLMKDR